MKHLLFILCCLCLSTTAYAHKPSDSYLAISASEKALSGQWDIALRDLEYALGVDSDNDGAITWLELREHKTAIFAYALNHLALSTQQQSCALTPQDLLVDEHSDGHYAVLRFQIGCPLAVTQTLQISYSLFFDIDPQHRGLFRLNRQQHTLTGIFSPAQTNQQFPMQTTQQPLQELMNFAAEGVGHIWAGYDHILFLLSLILPAALSRAHGSWRPKSGFYPVFWDVCKVVSAFTFAHSITLSLTALQVISLPSRWIEAAIAASVLLAALNNIFPLFIHRRTWFAFGFGLIHGMGIAGVLLDMGLGEGQRLWSLLGFNLGVEAGQLLIVSIALPLINVLSQYRYYPQVILRWGSASIAAMALVWLAERSLDFQINIF